ncbi:MAG: nitroreductase [Chloroflexota bacterium]
MAQTATAETILGALQGRRSMGVVRPDPVPRALVEQVIAAATWAPNHRRTAPWRFVVVAGDAREDLGAVMAASLRERLEDTTSAQAQAQVAKERQKPLRAPVIIAVAAVVSPDPQVVASEELAAVAAGVQNMLLAIEALGLGGMWRTGPASHDPAVKRFLGLPAEAHLVAFVYLGYPPGGVERPHPKDGGAPTTWLGWPESTAE